MSKLTQRQFVEQYAVKCGVTENTAAEYVDQFKKLIYELLRSGYTVELSGFGRFSISHRESRTGINPRTKERMTIAEHNTPKFKAGEAFKAAIKLHK